MTMALARISHGQQVPPEIFRTPTVRALEDTANDYASLLNDIFSYQKEIEFEGEVHNGVLAVQDFLGCGPAQAVAVVNDLMTSRMRQFEHIVSAELPALFEEYQLDEQAREALQQRAGELQDWMSAILNWHVQCGRYREPELIRRYRPATRQPPRGPTGLGTQGASIGGLLAAGSTPFATATRRAGRLPC
jgi:germacradienol/geosmin synthase